MGRVAWSLNINSFSEIITNEDNTYSVIFLKERYSGGFVVLEKVYRQIESLLLKEEQDLIKVSGVDLLFEKYNIVVNEEFSSF